MLLDSSLRAINRSSYRSRSAGVSLCRLINQALGIILLLGLCTILPLPILYGMYCNKGWSGETLCCAIVWAMNGGGMGCPNKNTSSVREEGVCE